MAGAKRSKAKRGSRTRKSGILSKKQKAVFFHLLAGGSQDDLPE